MQLSRNVIQSLAKALKDVSTKNELKEVTVYGDVVSITNGDMVLIDGANQATPVITAVDLEVGDRVSILLKDHDAVVTNIMNK